MSIERLQKVIAQGGVASRRAAEALITGGRVRVNGRVVTELGTKVDPSRDHVDVDGKRLLAERLVYLVMHKPRLVVSTLSDPEGRPTVKDLLKGIRARVVPVGRLDFHTSGVLLFTNDGELTHGLLHPKKAVPKTYVVKVTGEMSEADLARWRAGVQLDDGITRAAEVTLLRHEAGKTWMEVTLFEGRNQQIRRMGEATGFPVMRLARQSFAGVTIEGLRPGAVRPLTHDELTAMREHWGVPRRVSWASTGAAALTPSRERRAPSVAERAKAKHAPAKHGPAKHGPAKHAKAKHAPGRADQAAPAGRARAGRPAERRSEVDRAPRDRGPRRSGR